MMTVKELKEKLEKYEDDDIVVIEERYIDRDGWVDYRKVNGIFTIKKPFDK